MASWRKVKSIIEETFDIEDDGDSVKIQFSFNDGRVHQVFVTLAGNDQIGEWAHVSAPIGEIDDIDVEEAIKLSSDLLVGAVSCQGDIVILRHAVRMEDLQDDDILMAINAVVGSADQMEKELTDGEDDY